MNEHDLDLLERHLRTLPPLLAVPPDLVERSHRAAFAGSEPAEHASPSPRRIRGWRLQQPFAAVALHEPQPRPSRPCSPSPRRPATVGTGASPPCRALAVHPATSRSARRMAPSNRSRFRSATSGAPAHRYYEIWFQTGTEQVPGVAFNAGVNGTAEVQFHRSHQHQVGAVLGNATVRLPGPRHADDRDASRRGSPGDLEPPVGEIAYRPAMMPW